MLDWLKSALATIYGKDGIGGIRSIFVMAVVVLVLFGVALWFFGVDVAGIISGMFS